MIPQCLTPGSKKKSGFTLIELLAVIAIIALLAGLVIGLLPAVNQNKIRGRANAEIKSLETMLESYKSKKGFYPNDTNFNVTYKGNSLQLPVALYYELIGNSNGCPVFVANSGFETNNFARALKETQTKQADGYTFLGIPTKGPDGDFSFWRYDASSTNRHNPEGFDLWIDVTIKGDTHRFKNWTGE